MGNDEEIGGGYDFTMKPPFMLPALSIMIWFMRKPKAGSGGALSVEIIKTDFYVNILTKTGKMEKWLTLN